MRIFGSDKMAGLMRRLGVEKGEAITHPWVTRAIENAQRKVEGHNFDIRKQLLEYDNVANDQRRVMYDQRDALLHTNDISENIKTIRDSVVNAIISEHIPPGSFEDQWDAENLEKALNAELGFDLPVAQWLKEESDLHEENLRTRISNFADKAYEDKEAQVNGETMRRLEKSVMLHSIDSHWRDHLAQMEHLRQSVFLRGYAQKDPRQEYKREAFNLFSSMLESIKRQVISMLSLMEVKASVDVEAVEDQQRIISDESLEFQHQEMSSLSIPFQEEAANQKVSAAGGGATVARMAPKVGRNEICPCGSGKKYKHCHGRLIG
jgi:preprotein translocase subunit SecA